MRSLTRSWRRSVVVVGVGVLAASVIPATGQAQNVGDEADPPIDEWPATDIFHDSEFDSDAARDARRLEDGGASTFSTRAEPDEIVVEDGVTQPVFDYAGAVREAVRIPGAVSSEEGDEIDEIYVDIIRPAASEDGLQVPTIIIPSPYYHANGRGRLAERKALPGSPIDAFPLYYDNYFVPRGYAVALIDLAGTRGSTGCVDLGQAEIENTAKVVEWLAGNHVGYDLDGNEVAADWSNGKSGMTGKSWDGTVSNGVAATGVEGLTTIVPIDGISSWHHWFWHNGVHFQGHTAASLPNAIQGANSLVPDWRDRCASVRTEQAENWNEPDPELDFWVERDWVRNADQVQASVFIVHGTNDYNVKPINYGRWYDALAENDVPLKIWLAPVGHEKGFDFRRDEWMTTIHRWYDYWLHDIDNGIMDEPVADIETSLGNWETFDTWPGGSHTLLTLGQPEDADDPRPGVLSTGDPNLEPGSKTFVPANRRSANAVAANGFDDDSRRLVFMTDELEEPVRVSGETTISLEASIDGPDATFAAYLVDYGTDTRTNYDSSGGIRNLSTISCFGEGTDADTGCYPDVERITRTQAHEVVSRGWARASFVTGEDEFDPDESYRVEWDVMTDDYTFKAGHRIGIVIAGTDTNIRSVDFTPNVPVEVHLDGSHVIVPVVDGALYPAWTPEQVYTDGDQVSHSGKVYRATWWTQGETPGSSDWGSWQEIAIGPDGVAVWTSSRIFDTGDIVTHNGTTYVAKWWTRNQEPGDPWGPWEIHAP